MRAPLESLELLMLGGCHHSNKVNGKRQLCVGLILPVSLLTGMRALLLISWFN